MISLAERIDALLPQTQCTRCGYDGCRPYAEAIAEADAPINRCPPGGAAGVARLAALLGKPVVDLDPACGVEAPRRIAHIDPSVCIGCTKCIAACPVDAIVGAARRMHTVIPELCSGCERCLPPCPVDCIALAPSPQWPGWTDDDAQAARERHERRGQRLARERLELDRRMERRAQGKLARLHEEPPDAGTERKRRVIEAAIRRARERLAARTGTAS